MEKGFVDSLANRFMLKDIYSMNDFNNEMEKLKAKYGAEKTEKAMVLAKVILDENSLEHIEDIVLLMDQYGLDKVHVAFDKVSRYKIDNPIRSLRYVAGIVREEDEIENENKKF